MFDRDKVFLGIAPIGWCNDDMPELGAENTFRQIVSEMALAGFQGTEIGNKYPKDPVELKQELDLRGLRVASRWFSSFLLSQPYEQVASDFARELDFLLAVGARRINVSEQSRSIQGQMDTPVLGEAKPVMSEADWARLTQGLDRLGEMALVRGVRLCYHHHMGTVVQTAEETDRLMDSTDPRYVYLCYDTGHFTFAGEDPLLMLDKHAGRVGHVHLKDMRPQVVAQVKEQGWSFLRAVREGAFTVPGDGAVDFGPILKRLSKANYEGWLLVEAEQDPARANPLAYAIKARDYIRKHTGL
ncbi:MAG: myo-inosose-2 dehydratase [Clostridiales bacterium]|nr:myo-inosose-2 dehydratase [Clostridiales bacterium]